MAFVTIGTKKVYGPLSIDDEFTVERLTRAQIKYIYENFNGVIALMISGSRWGIWAESTCTRQCRHASFRVDDAYPVPSTYPVCSPRSGPSTRYFPSEEVERVR